MSGVYRIYLKGSRVPRNYLGRVPAENEEDAKAVWIRMAKSKYPITSLDATPAHVTRKPGK